jgi:hypothetical protein
MTWSPRQGASNSTTARLDRSSQRRWAETLADIAVEGLSPTDLLANALALFAANEIRPVGPGCAEVGKLNAAILARPDSAEALPYLAVPCGTGFRLEPALFSAMRDGLSHPTSCFRGRNFCAATASEVIDLGRSDATSASSVETTALRAARPKDMLRRVCDPAFSCRRGSDAKAETVTYITARSIAVPMD